MTRRPLALVTGVGRRAGIGAVVAGVDTAALVGFLLGPDGGWVNGQLLKSDGGFSAR